MKIKWYPIEETDDRSDALMTIIEGDWFDGWDDRKSHKLFLKLISVAGETQLIVSDKLPKLLDLNKIIVDIEKCYRT